jgi:hypothetical protein
VAPWATSQACRKNQTWINTRYTGQNWLVTPLLVEWSGGATGLDQWLPVCLPFRALWQMAIRSCPRFLRPLCSFRTAGFPASYVARHVMLSGVSAMVRPEGVGKHSVVARTIADTLPLN